MDEDKDFDIESATDEELSKYQEKLWDEIYPEVEGTGLSDIIIQLCEVERELTLREEDPR